MEFWNKLSAALKDKDFSAAQIKKLQEAFGHLDAAGLLRLPPDQLLPAMTGRTVLEKQAKIQTLLATVKEVADRSEGVDDANIIVIKGRLTGLPQETPWQTFTVGLLDQKRSDRRDLFRVPLETGGGFAFRIPADQWRRIFPDDGSQLVFRVYGNDRVIHTTRDPFNISSGQPPGPVTIPLPKASLDRLLAATAPERLRREMAFKVIADAAELPTAVQTQLRQANLTKAGDLFDPAATMALKNVTLSAAQTRRLFAVGRWTLLSGDVELAKKLVDARFDSLGRLAHASRAQVEGRFEQAGKPLNEEEKAGLISLISQARAGNNLMNDVFVDQSQRPEWMKRPDSIIDDIRITDDPEDTASNPLCADCDACTTVFSPLAYAYDLVTFIEGNWGLEPPEIEALILQEIDLDCAAAQAPVQQIILAIGVLERYLTDELSAPFTGNVAWRNAYRERAGELLEWLGLDPTVSAPPAPQQSLYQVAHKNNPLLQDILKLVELARDYFGNHIAGGADNAPIPPPETDDPDYAAYLADQMQAEAERNSLLRSFEKQLETLISPLFVDYRERLIAATGKDGATLEPRLFIDLHTAPCQITTRIIQIVQSLHSFVLAIRTRIIGDNDREPVKDKHIDPEHFDEASWHWLQSFAAWNAAMYVLIYPENLFSLPTQRQRMTGFFRRIASRFASGRITHGEVVESEQSFVSYFRRFGSFRPFAANVVGESQSGQLVVFARAGSVDDFSLWMNVVETSLFPFNPSTPEREQVNADGWIEVYGWRATLRPVMALPFGKAGEERFVVLALDKSGGWTTYRVTAEGGLEGESKFEYAGGVNEVTLSSRYSFGSLTPVVWSRHGDQWQGSELDEFTGEWSEPEPQTTNLPWFKFQDFEDAGTLVRVGNSIAAVKRDDGRKVTLSYSLKDDSTIQVVAKSLTSYPAGQDYGHYTPLLAWSRAILTFYNPQANNYYDDYDSQTSFVVFMDADQQIYVSRIWLNTDNGDPSYARRLSEEIEPYADDRTWPADLTEGLARDIRLAERYLYFPLLAGWALNRTGDYVSAHDWYRRLYDPFANPRQVFPFDTYFQGAFQRPDDWLSGIVDPDAVAGRRGGSYLRHAILMMTRNLLDWADHEFALNNLESRNRARELYQLAARVLQAPALNNPCMEQLQALEFAVAHRLRDTPPADGGSANVGAAYVQLIRRAIEQLRRINLRKVVTEAKARIEDLLEQNLALREFERKLQHIVREAIEKARQRQDEPVSFNKRFELDGKKRERLERALDPNWSKGLFGTPAGRVASPQIGNAVSIFCIPLNPLLEAYRTRIEIRLALLRNCLDINGESSQPQLTGSLQGRVITTFGQLQAAKAGTAIESPRYRYDFLVEKARQYTGLAQQLASLMLSAIEKRDSAALALLQAEIAEEVAAATITLRNLTREEALQAVQIASIQLDRALADLGFWEGRAGDGMTIMGAGGLNEAEMAGMALMGTSGVLQGMAAMGYFLLAAPTVALGLAGGASTLAGGAAGVVGTVAGLVAAPPTGGWGLAVSLAALVGGTATVAGGIAAMGGALVAGGQTLLSGVQAAAGSAGTFGSLALTFASFERRWEEWQHQHELATIGRQLADAQLTQTQFRVTITAQEQAIAELQHGHARLVIDYLKGQFGNEQLYQWMIGVLQEAYRGVMQNATATARLAQRALEFERQQSIDVIQGDYWTIDEATLSEEQRASGLLGAERLLADISHLDEWKIRTDKRRLQLSKTLSLAQMLPSEFMRLRETGRMDFPTLMEWFDWDFPGHYLRLIKTIKVSVIALVPPVDGIHATLSNSGLSRVVVNDNGSFIELDALQRFPETVALDSPISDTGVFVLDYNDPMLLPFEGLGVATQWWFELPRPSNRLNYDSLVDVLFTIDYTAYQNAAYRGQVIHRLGDRKNSDLVISLRHSYPDQWYDLHNPGDPTTAQTMRFALAAHTFLPPAGAALGLQHLMVLLVGPAGKGRSGDLVLQKVGMLPELPITTDEHGAYSSRIGAGVDEAGAPRTRFAVDPANAGILLPPKNLDGAQLLDPRGEWQFTFNPIWYDATNGGPVIDELADIILIPTVVYDVTWPS